MSTRVFTEKETLIRHVAFTTQRERGLSATVSNRGSETPRRVPWFIPADQLYYWSNQWQRDEAESLADLEAGRSQTFDNPQDAIRHLLDD
jgi:hypothetical protein